MPAHNVRFASPFVAAADAVARGEIGRVHGFRAAFGHGGPQMWAPGSTWFRDPALAGGGALIDLGVHVIDMLRAVLVDDVVEVTALIDRPSDGAVEEDAQVLLRFAGGATGSVHASWSARPGPDHQLTLFGSDGTLHLDGGTPLSLRRASGGKPEVVELPVLVTDIYAAFVASGARRLAAAGDRSRRARRGRGRRGCLQLRGRRLRGRDRREESLVTPFYFVAALGRMEARSWADVTALLPTEAMVSGRPLCSRLGSTSSMPSTSRLSRRADAPAGAVQPVAGEAGEDRRLVRLRGASGIWTGRRR